MMKHQKQRIPTKNRNIYLYGVIVVGIVFYLLFLLIRSFSQSLFVNQKDRINFLVYGKHTAVYSIGLIDGQDYIIPFSSQMELDVPGGYGTYKVGAVGKLVKLDKEPEVFSKTFSLAVGTLVPYYFYDDLDIIYYDSSDPSKSDLSPGRNVFLLFHSNVSFFDKIYLTVLMGQRDYERFKIVSSERPFDQQEFTKRTLGLFYEKIYRSEKKNIQLHYIESYPTAQRIGAILEGSGIRVNDISLENEKRESCLIKEESAVPSFTAKTMITFFGCKRTQGETGVYDILFYLGDELERSWEI